MFSPYARALAVFACLIALAPARAGGSDDVLVVVELNPLRSIDPAHASSDGEQRIVDALYEGLAELDPGSRQPLPAAARTWSLGEDRRTWTFHLREDARWTTGEPVVAGDFARAWRRLSDSTWDYLLESLASWEAADTRTLRVRTRRAMPQLPALLCHPAFSPVHESMPREPQGLGAPGDLVVNGAFRLASADPSGHVRIERNPTFRARGEVALAAVRIIYASFEDALAAYGNEDAHWITGVPPGAWPAVETMPGAHEIPQLLAFYLLVNKAHPALRDPRVRRGLSLAIDREAIARAVEPWRPATSLVPPGIPGYAPARLPTRNGPGRARALLDEAGWRHDAALGLRARTTQEGVREPFPRLRILFSTEDRIFREIASLLTEQLRDGLGVPLQAEFVPWAEYLERRDDGDFDLAWGGWIGDYFDPMTFLGRHTAWGANSPLSYAGSEFTRLVALANEPERLLADPDALPDGRLRLRGIESLVASLRRAHEAKGEDPIRRLAEVSGARHDLRMALLEEAERVLVEDAHVIPIAGFVQRGILAPGVEGFQRATPDPLSETRGAAFISYHPPYRVLRIGD